MSFHLIRHRTPLLKQMIFAVGLSLAASQGLAQRADAPFTGLAGYWSGGGAITLSNGSNERIRCKATYAVHASGRAMNQTLRCASDSYRLEISSNVVSEGGAVSGSWSEATRNVTGNISGRATSAAIQARVSGGAFSASIDVRTHGNSQSVTIRPSGGTDVTDVSVTLRRS